MNKQVRIRVSGRVQGVSFRAYARQKASELGLTGYVRNLSNGDVEILAQGAEDPLSQLVEWAREGPPLAQVKHARIDFEPVSGAYERFEIGETVKG
jgi:acylphosphatase